MKVWIDADAAPQEVKEIVYRASARLQLPTVLVANRALATPAGYPLVTAIQVSQGADVADRLIVARAEPGDLVVTADIPLAALLVERGIQVISPHGEEYSEANIRSRLAMRDFFDHLRGSGVETGGAAPYGAKDKQAFAAALDRLLTRAVRRK